MSITHAKTANVPDWTQEQLDAQIAAGNIPAGTTLDDVVLASDFNAAHVVSDLGAAEFDAATNASLALADSALQAGDNISALTNDAGYLTSVSNAVSTKTANYTVTTSDYLIRGDATSGNITITLPTAVGNSGRVFIVKKIDSSVNTVTIDGNGSETIDGSLTKVLSTQYASYSLISNNVSWDVI